MNRSDIKRLNASSPADPKRRFSSQNGREEYARDSEGVARDSKGLRQSGSKIKFPVRACGQVKGPASYPIFQFKIHFDPFENGFKEFSEIDLKS